MNHYFIYSSEYDISLMGGMFHPFDGKKFSKAWSIISQSLGEKISQSWIEPTELVSDSELLKIHTETYLESLNRSAEIANVIEVPAVKLIPNYILKKKLLKPIKLACKGTVQATQLALKERAIAMNFGGGFHHAFAEHGEGFCFFADAALSILICREKGLIGENEKVLMIDVDAHRGNGFEALTQGEPTIQNFDMYNFQNYPGLHTGEPDEFPYMIPLKSGIKDEQYLKTLKVELDKFLAENEDAALVFYNAGSDILDSDPLGGLKVSFGGVVERDRFVIEQLAKRNIPTVIMTSGGYTEQSHRLIAKLAETVANNE
ncbi:MAG: histone deacetylase [Kangiellaceae bacterium]|nr:histone deacetylase [Kangiellaceae bacterium]